MKHAGPDALDTLENLLTRLRQHSSLTEKKRGIFYRKSSAFLHFHEERDHYVADVRIGANWVRFPVNTPAEQDALLSQVARVLQP